MVPPSGLEPPRPYGHRPSTCRVYHSATGAYCDLLQSHIAVYPSARLNVNRACSLAFSARARRVCLPSLAKVSAAGFRDMATSSSSHRAVGDLQRGVKNGQSLAQLLLADDKRRVDEKGVPAHKGE